MQIEKIVKIESIGRFLKLAAKGDVKFRPLTLLYGANGQGKTTIAGVLRSLHNGDPAFVNERSSAGSPVSPNAELRLTGSTAVFKDGKWNTTLPELEIFDTTFVSDNV